MVHANQKHVAGDDAIIPPVENLRGNVLRPPFIIGLYHHEVFPFLKEICDIKAKRSKAPLVMACRFAVHINVCIMAGAPSPSRPIIAKALIFICLFVFTKI